ncbi:MAG: DUF5320 domain-containing protein [Firmicutes bacterium]|nr:DUF5320 domain-containing protein [Bacillota bacterium]
MPGFDGSGPAGGGPLTGWGRGYCAQPLSRAEGVLPRAGRRRAMPRRGMRLGFGFGMGRGRGRRRWW